MLLLNFNPFPCFSTERLILRRMTEKDDNEIFFLRSDPQMLQFLDRDPAKSIDEARQWIDTINEGINKNENIAWGIALKGDDKLIGTITFWNIQKQHYRAEIGYALNTDFQGRGLMHEAMTAILDYAFNTLKIHSVEANVNPGNAASIKLLERNGFVREAYHRENHYYNGHFLDSAIYSLINPFGR